MLALAVPEAGQALAYAPTLDELIVNAWEGLTARHTVTCLVCGSEMTPESDAAGRRLDNADGSLVGRCDSCGCTLW